VLFRSFSDGPCTGPWDDYKIKCQPKLMPMSQLTSRVAFDEPHALWAWRAPRVPPATRGWQAVATSAWT